ncbi:glycoside hydrolase family 25 protein [Paraburkholderia solisilvae]|uniref:Lysozyme n=1 Tax=Paraburkholderia solisilvae TaxID=624376 RepID=A0A6J5DVE2_9BURK|nr:glycoside hydrolase family 25 protein [Paraburkholderia solisilvae]CAB3757607.1 hypothetical protein LMG29739_02728 [Paraburkholderia solisilvae]
MPRTLNGSIDVVLDLYHGNELSSLSEAKADGIVALIHKASEGSTVQDPMYSNRRHEARAAGLLWGAYHFASGAPVQDQVDNFLKAIQWGVDSEFDKQTLLCLDFEASHSGPDMPFDGVCEFVEKIQEKTGRWPMIYGGALLVEKAATAAPNCAAANCPLWFARYNNEPIDLPKLWTKFTLWQYTDGSDGPQPTQTAKGKYDRSCFVGNLDQLKAQWPQFN